MLQQLPVILIIVIGVTDHFQKWFKQVRDGARAAKVFSDLLF
jgi:hypothetical protein